MLGNIQSRDVFRPIVCEWKYLRDYNGHVMCSDQTSTSENIWGTINFEMLILRRKENQRSQRLKLWARQELTTNSTHTSRELNPQFRLQCWDTKQILSPPPPPPQHSPSNNNDNEAIFFLPAKILNIFQHWSKGMESTSSSLCVPNTFA